MTDLPSQSDLVNAITAAGSVHHHYEQTALDGVRDDMWPAFYAAFVLGRLGEFTSASELAALFEQVDAPNDWSDGAADHVLRHLRA